MCLVEIAPKPGAARDDARRPRVGREGRATTGPFRSRSCSLPATRPPPKGWRSSATRATTWSRRASDVQEFLLLNHPVDCPICDQSGECKLQDYWLEHGQYQKRMRDEPVHKPKGVVFGPTIVYDAERCVMCTRCVRFMAEVAKDPVLDMRERGNLNEIIVVARPRARRTLHVHDRARVPGRRAHDEGLPLQGARLVSAHGAEPFARAARRVATRTSTTTRATTRPTATGRATTRRSTSSGCATRGCSPTRRRTRDASSRPKVRGVATSNAKALEEVKTLFEGVAQGGDRHRPFGAALARGQLGAAASSREFSSRRRTCSRAASRRVTRTRSSSTATRTRTRRASRSSRRGPSRCRRSSTTWPRAGSRTSWPSVGQCPWTQRRSARPRSSRLRRTPDR